VGRITRYPLPTHSIRGGPFDIPVVLCAIMDEGDAIWYLSEAARYCKVIENQFSDLDNLIKMVVQALPPEESWPVVKPILKNMGISIRKPAVPIDDLRDLTGLEISKRYQEWVCGDPLCYAKTGRTHCQECGIHGISGDGHLCHCKRCDENFSSTQQHSKCPNCF